MKTFTLLLIIFANLSLVFPQNNCGITNNGIFPPSPNTEGYMQFDGKGDFLRTSDDDRVDLVYDQTDSFSIETRIKITSPYTPMRIMGKYYGSTGWAITYHMSEWGVLCFTIGSTSKNICVLGIDTTWHSYKIIYSKQNLRLDTYVDDILTHSYDSTAYSGAANDAAFSIGNIGLASTYGFYSVTQNNYWFNGGIDYFRLNRNGSRLLKYEFNEGAGQFALDSASYYITDKTITGIPSCGSLHLMLGFMPAVDTCDPQWVTGESTFNTNFSSLSSGLSFYYQNGNNAGYIESSSIAMTVWNGNLVSGGQFNRAGGIEAQRIAMWDNGQWLPIGGGFNHEVYSLGTYKGQLYAGGYFDTAYGFGEKKFIARWDGSQWNSLDRGTDNLVTVMKEYNGDLIVGGYFLSAGQIYAPRIAKWDGTEWHSMGIGMSGPVLSLCVYNGELYAGGNFQYAGTEVCHGIAKWTAKTGWQHVGTGVAGGEASIYCLYEYNGELWAGGGFTSIDGVQARNIAKFNGTSWSSLGSGASGYSCSYTGGNVVDMQLYNKSLYVTGQFTSIDGVYANKIAKYCRGVWCNVEFGADLQVKSLEAYKGALILGGAFYSLSGRGFSNIASYNPGTTLVPELDNNEKQAENISLGQNYPNPFNPSTEIKFELVNPGKVKIAVYNVLGEQVAELLNGYAESGVHMVRFEASLLPSGVYFYKLVSGSYVDVKRMVLVK